MKPAGRNWWRGIPLVFALWGGMPGTVVGANYLRWDKEHHRVDASIQTWDTREILRRIATSAQWQIFVEPDVRQVLPTRFRNLSEGDALRRLLGDLSYAQVPQTNGPPRLYVFRTTRDDATELVKALDPAALAKGQPIEDELVVKLKPGESIDELAKRLGAKVVGRVDGLNTYRLKFTDADQASQARESLAKDPSVASVDYNYSIPRAESADATSAPPPRFSLDPKAPADGKYLIVGLIDSEVQAKEGRVGNFMLDPISVTGDETTPSDVPTHGTAMSETILNGLAAMLGQDRSTAVRILPVDVYGNSSSTSTFDVAVGIYKAVEAGARIINLSLGSEADSPFLHEVITSSYKQGVIFFASPGNEPVTTANYPAAYPEVTAVTAVDRAGNIVSYANRGDYVKAGGPGTVFVTFNDRTYVVSGTSAATAYVSGVAAGAAEKTGKPLSQIEKTIPTLMPVKK
jgi:hypothetical protein